MLNKTPSRRIKRVAIGGATGGNCGQDVSAVWLICQDLNELEERPSRRDYFCEEVLSLPQQSL